MEFLRHGKTKDVYKLEDGNILLKFKDTVTGNAETGESDPGGNQVVGTKAGIGSSALKMTSYYFELLHKCGVNTHYVSSDLAENSMVVRPAKTFGKGLEFVVRYKAAGSFIRRFGQYIKENAELDGIFEITLKDDERNDPPATAEIAVALGLITKAQIVKTEKLVKKVCRIIKDDLSQKGLDLIDIKVEVGIVDDRIALIDEVSGGNMRVYKDGKQLGYVELSEYIK